MNHLDLFPVPNELNYQEINKTLVIIDYCTIINSVNLTQLFVYGRPLNINTIYLSQKYTKVPATIKENCNVFILFKQSVTTVKKNIYNVIGDQFDNEKEMIICLKVNIIDKHDFIMLNKNDNKWFSKYLKPINSGMGLIMKQKKTSRLANEVLNPDKQYYLEAKAKAYKAEQANRKTINNLQHFSSALLERTSEVLKRLTTMQNQSLEQETEIVAQLKNQNAQIINL